MHLQKYKEKMGNENGHQVIAIVIVPLGLLTKLVRHSDFARHFLSVSTKRHFKFTSAVFTFKNFSLELKPFKSIYTIWKDEDTSGSINYCVIVLVVVYNLTLNCECL